MHFYSTGFYKQGSIEIQNPLQPLVGENTDSILEAGEQQGRIKTWVSQKDRLESMEKKAGKEQQAKKQQSTLHCVYI